MHIEPNSGLGALPWSSSFPPTREREETPVDSVNFSEAGALGEALRAEPETRPEVVERARKLIGQVNWPPDEAIQQLAELLAIRMHPESHSNESAQ